MRGKPTIAQPTKPTRSFNLPRYKRVTAQVEKKGNGAGARVCFLLSNYKNGLFALTTSQPVYREISLLKGDGSNLQFFLKPFETGSAKTTFAIINNDDIKMSFHDEIYLAGSNSGVVTGWLGVIAGSFSRSRRTTRSGSPISAI